MRSIEEQVIFLPHKRVTKTIKNYRGKETIIKLDEADIHTWHEA